MQNHHLLFIVLILANLALFFFLYWQPRKRRKKEEKGLFFDSIKGPIYYQVNGKKKETLLLIHGLGASAYSWRKVIPLLENDFKVITIDLWGFGKSSKDAPLDMDIDEHLQIIEDLLDYLHVDKVHVVGNSMGAHIALWMATQLPERVDKVIAISPASDPRLVPQYIRRMKWISNWTPLVVNHNMVRRMLLNVLGNPHNIDTEMVEAYLEPYLDAKAHLSFAASLKVIEDDRVFNSLPTIKKPVLTLWGERDRVIPRKVINKIVAQLPSVELKTHPKSGHCPMEEHPEWCAENIISFIQTP